MKRVVWTTIRLLAVAAGCNAREPVEQPAAEVGAHVASDSGAGGAAGSAGKQAQLVGGAGAAACKTISLSVSSAQLTAAPPLRLAGAVDLLGDGLPLTLMAQQNPSAGPRWQGDRMYLTRDTGFWEIPVEGPARWYPTSTTLLWGVRAGDLDGDGDQDLLVLSMSLSLNVDPDADAGTAGAASPFVSRLTVWERGPDGLSERGDVLRVAAMSFPIPYALGDVDADGDLDVVTFERGVAVGYVNRGAFMFERETLSEGAPAQKIVGSLLVDLADRNGDGLLDLLVIGGDASVSPLENTTFVVLGQPAGKFGTPNPGTTGKAPLVPHGPDGIGIGIADVTGDGLADVIMQDPSAPDAGIMRLHKSVSPTELAPPVELSGLGFAFADVDADGATDIVTTRSQHMVALLSRASGEFEARDLGLDTSTPEMLGFVVDPGQGTAAPVLHVLQQQSACP